MVISKGDAIHVLFTHVQWPHAILRMYIVTSSCHGNIFPAENCINTFIRVSQYLEISWPSGYCPGIIRVFQDLRILWQTVCSVNVPFQYWLSRDGQSISGSWDTMTNVDSLVCTCIHPGTVLGWSEYFGTYALVWYTSYPDFCATQCRHWEHSIHVVNASRTWLYN